jgi:hypothetical protein
MKQNIIVIITGLSLSFLTGCEKYLENTKLPAGTIAGTEAYVSDNSVSAIVTGNLLNLNSGAFGGGSSANLAYISGLYTDELKPLPNTTGNTTNAAFYANAITSNNTGHWTDLYKKIYVVNAAIEGIQGTPATLYNKNQWLGESYFLRAMLYFYLVNLYGDAPLALTTDYVLNNTLSRAPQNDVYQQIVKDLKEAQNLLSADYKDGYGVTTTFRVRPNKAVATAFLARVYLYMQDWANAETQANAVIGNPAYQLLPPAQVFLTNSKETIWALATKNDERAYEYGFYNGGMPVTTASEPRSFSVLVSMNSLLTSAFEPNDARYTNWVRSTVHTGVNPAVTYYFPNKFKSSATGAEKQLMIRLAELYLIRAEARARLNNITGINSAATDLDAVRTRANLPGTTATTQTDMLSAIMKERQVELFTECANRFFDLKRTGTIGTVMSSVAPQKGGAWSSFKQLWPIPPNDVILNPNLTPNPGY